MTSRADLGILVTERMSIAELLLAKSPYNPRTMTDAARAGLGRSLEEFGLVQPVVWNRRTRTVVGGHRRLDELHAKGATHTDTVVVDLDETRERALNLALNNPGIQGTFTDGVRPILDELLEHAQELAEALQLATIHVPPMPELQAPRAAPREPWDPDSVPDAVPPVTEVGDVWTLGGHVIACGDNSDAALVKRVLGKERAAVVVTDPPYAIFGSSSGIATDISDDRMVRDFFLRVLRLAYGSLPYLAHAYVFCDWRSYPAWWEAARGASMAVKNALVWEKGGGGLGSNYVNAYEMILFLHKLPANRHVGGIPEAGRPVRTCANVLRYPRPHGAERLHNAAKPVDLLVQLVTNSTDEGARVFDPFLGSGSTLIACEKSGRRCVGLDVEPKEIDKTVARWERLTGGKGVRARAR